jgi:hypothetical protein
MHTSVRTFTQKSVDARMLTHLDDGSIPRLHTCITTTIIIIIIVVVVIVI